ncbi:MAG: aminoacyl-histidine dipeptidase [Bacteroidales bacterium]
MSRAIEGLQPALVWKYFAQIAAIPHGSKNEAAIAKYVMETARRLGLTARQDKVGSVLVKKPPTPGHENAPSVCLQGHLDMVCEKHPDKQHDFLKDPLELVRSGGYIMANGTTLGADNGIAVATCLAIMEDKGLHHGPLEFLFTIDEETGLTGAGNLEPGFVESRILLNLDSEEEGELYVGCAGGRDTRATWPAEYEDAPKGAVPLLIKVSGLRGGHSGLEIDKNRGNAIKIVNRLVIAAGEFGARLSKMNGGNKHNAIPRDAEAVVFVPATKQNDATAAVRSLADAIKHEMASVEPNFAVEVSPVKGVRAGKVMKRGLQKKLTTTLAALPHGVMKMSSDIPGLVETSTNLAVVTTDKKAVSIVTSQRSSVESEIKEVAQTVRAVLDLGGAEVKASDGYPGWKPNLASPILKVAQDTYTQMFGKEPAVKAVHAGLECGIIGEKYPGMDMVSFGPTMSGVHSPDEKLEIDTVPKFYEFLLGILKNVR